MTALYHLNENIAHLLEGFLESAVPLIAGLAEVIGLFIIVTSLVKATYTMCGRPFSTTGTTSTTR